MKHAGLPLIIISLYFLVSLVNSYNILVVFPHPGKSHFDSFALLFKTLAQKGHNITVISFFPMNERIPNYRNIQIEGFQTFNDSRINAMLDMKNISPKNRLFKYLTFVVLDQLGQSACELGFSSKSVQDFLKEENHFDLAILEYFNSDCFLTLAKKYDVPVVRVHTATAMPWTFSRYGFAPNPAYIPNNFLHFSQKITFWERVENTVFTFIHNIYFNTVMVRKERRISMQYFGELGSSLTTDVLNDSLLLLGTHFTVNSPQPLVPNVIEVGGIHIGKAQSLPKDIEEWITESDQGIIYFSLGSMVKTHTMPAEKRQIFINVFKKLPQRVLLRWENDTMEGKTDNIMIKRWMPQFDILSHPNVKAFISHGGLLGTFEAVHNAVPVLVIPQFGDQHTNAQSLKASGGGEILYLDEITEDTLYNTLKNLLSPEYQKKAKLLSERFRDRPMPPLETALYWIDYVIRYKGAHFMKTAAVGMPFYQYYLLDVILFILVALTLILYATFLLLRLLCRSLSKKKSEKLKKS